MKKINHITFGLILSFFCILQVQVAFAQEAKVSFNSILRENIISILDLPSYNAGLQSRDQFIYILPLGLALDLKLLTFNDLSYDQLLINRSALDNGYQFARMVNDIMIFKGNSYAQGGELERYGSQSKLLSSPTYANRFGLISMMPSPEHISWTDFSKIGKGEIKYALNFSLGRLDLERGWLDMDSFQDMNLPKGSAIIVSLILANKLQLNLYRNGSLSDKMKFDDITIVGFICVVI